MKAVEWRVLVNYRHVDRWISEICERALPHFPNCDLINMVTAAVDDKILRRILNSGPSGLTDKSKLETMDLLSSQVRFRFLMSRGGGASQYLGGGRSMVTSYSQNNARPQFC